MKPWRSSEQAYVRFAVIQPLLCQGTDLPPVNELQDKPPRCIHSLCTGLFWYRIKPGGPEHHPSCDSNRVPCDHAAGQVLAKIHRYSLHRCAALHAATDVILLQTLALADTHSPAGLQAEVAHSLRGRVVPRAAHHAARWMAACARMSVLVSLLGRGVRTQQQLSSRARAVLAPSWHTVTVRR